MKKKQPKKPNGNVFKTVVRSVVREELGKFEEQVEKQFHKIDERFDKNESWLERLDQKIDSTFRRYRDDILTKLDEMMGELKAIREEQAAQLGLHRDVEERVENLETIHPHGQHTSK